MGLRLSLRASKKLNKYERNALGIFCHTDRQMFVWDMMRKYDKPKYNQYFGYTRRKRMVL
jgi:hypothetical protein